MTYILLIFSLMTPIKRISDNHIRDYYVCSQQEKNCEFVINFFISRAKSTIQISNYRLQDYFIKKSLHNLIGNNVSIRALININELEDIDFYIGNEIAVYIDEHNTLKSYFIVDDKITIIIKQGTIEVLNNTTTSYIYENEFIKHMNHSSRIEESNL